MPRTTKEEKEAICKMYESGLNTVEIASKFSVSNVAISGILKRRGVAIRHPSKRQRHPAINDNAFSLLSREAFYWAGFILADGHIAKRRFSPEVSIGQSIDKLFHLNLLKNFLVSEHKIIIYTQETAYGTTEMCRLSFASQQIADDLEQLGVSGYKLDRVPSDAACTSKDFWRGVLDADGYIGKDSQGYSRLELVGSDLVVVKFLEHLNKNGLMTKASSRKSKSIYRTQLHGCFVDNVLEYLYEKGQPGLKYA